MKLGISVEGRTRDELSREAGRVLDSFNRSVANVMGETIGFGAMWQLHPDAPSTGDGTQPQVDHGAAREWRLLLADIRKADNSPEDQSINMGQFYFATRLILEELVREVTELRADLASR